MSIQIPNMPSLFCMLMLPRGKKELLTVRNSLIKHGPEIPNMLEAVKLPEQVAVMHCKGPQKDMSPISQGNRRQTKRQRRQHQGLPNNWPHPPLNGPDIKPSYTSGEIPWAWEQGSTNEGPWVYIGQNLVLPQ